MRPTQRKIGILARVQRLLLPWFAVEARRFGRRPSQDQKALHDLVMFIERFRHQLALVLQWAPQLPVAGELRAKRGSAASRRARRVVDAALHAAQIISAAERARKRRT